MRSNPLGDAAFTPLMLRSFKPIVPELCLSELSPKAVKRETATCFSSAEFADIRESLKLDRLLRRSRQKSTKERILMSRFCSDSFSWMTPKIWGTDPRTSFTWSGKWFIFLSSR